MRINLRIFEEEANAVISEGRVNPPSLPHSFRNEPIDWAVEYKSSDLAAQDLLGHAGSPCVLLVDAGHKSVFDRLRDLEREMHELMKNNPDLPLFPSPVIAVLRSPAMLGELTDFPDIVTDWVYAPLVPLDIARRVFFALERRCSIKFGLQFAGVTVIPETRQVVYEGQSVRLTSSEYTLLELFVKRMGAVIPSNELALFFKSSGKSAEPNNIRVSIFQLRMKLESITRSRVTLASVHKQGYRLRQKSAFSSVIHPAHMVPNELSASVVNCIDSGQMTYGKL